MVDGTHIKAMRPGDGWRDQWRLSTPENRYSGLIHREHDLPAIVGYREDGTMSYKEWFYNGKRQRFNDCPSYIEYYPNENIERRTWYSVKNDVSNIHRDDDLPACISFHESGSIHTMRWSFHGLVHREDGPAKITYDINGNITALGWYVYSQRYDIYELEKYIALPQYEKVAIKMVFGEMTAWETRPQFKSPV